MIHFRDFSNCVIEYSQVSDGDMKNVTIMPSIFHTPTQTLVVPRLQHGSRIVQIPTTKTVDCDAVFTLDPQCALGVRVADCLPIVLSAHGKGIAVIHGGWRSLLDRIVEKTLQEFFLATQTKPEEVAVWIGPSIQACCNTMKDIPVQYEHQAWKPFITKKNEIYHVDLQGYVEQACQQLGILRQHIINTCICTYHQKDAYFSYRRYTQEERGTGHIQHMGVVAWIEG